MSDSFLSRIDWERPWLAPLLPIAQPILQAANWRDALNIAASALRNHRGLPVRFVPQADLPVDIAYEAFISSTGNVPTRDNLHDFFNALIWLTYPGIKAQLNALQAAEIARAAARIEGMPSLGTHRGKLRDAATIFDENAALLIVSDSALVDALRNHLWHEVFMNRRAAFGNDCEVHLFGHALLEKLNSPYKAITAHTWVVMVDSSFFALKPEQKRSWIDMQVAGQLASGSPLSGFTPLPVLGVPGWHDHQDMEFYEDITVFRPKRREKG